MNCYTGIKYEEEHRSNTEIKSEEQVSYKSFIAFYIFLKFMTNVLKHIAFIVFQDVKSEIKTEEEEREMIHIKEEKLPTIHLIPSIKKEEEEEVRYT